MKHQPALLVRLWQDERPPAVDYHGASGVARLMVGRPPKTAPDLLASLFAICPAAQRLAAHRAIAVARATPMDVVEEASLARAARLEMVREHGLHILLGWGGRMGDAPDRNAAATVNSIGRSGGMLEPVSEVLDRLIFAMPLGEWLHLDGERGVSEWAQRGESVAARYVASALQSRKVPVHPTGAPAGSLLARHERHPLMRGAEGGSLAAFALARLIDLAMQWRGLSGSDMAGAAGNEACTPCSRGTLTHRAWVEGEEIVHYEITSPTDLAFEAGGHGRQWLGELMALPADDREDAARRIVQALDPCVEYRIEVR